MELQLKYLTSLIAILIISLSGCSVKLNEIQSIDINIYPETERNVKLTKDLIYYDPRYIAHKIPSLNESTAQGIKIGYFVRSSDGKPSYRITYNMKVPEIVKNIDLLNSDFKSYIPKLASFHASKEKVFNRLSSKGEKWTKSLFQSSAKQILSASSSILKGAVTTDQLAAFINDFTSKNDTPTSTNFVRAQYYEEFANVPESVSLYYLQTYKNNNEAFIRVSYHQEGGEWKVMGFSIKPQSE